MSQKTYRLELIGHKEPTYLVESDVVKLVQQAQSGVKLILVGTTFINPSSIARICRAYDVDASVIEEADQEVIQLLEGKQPKRLV